MAIERTDGSRRARRHGAAAIALAASLFVAAACSSGDETTSGTIDASNGVDVSTTTEQPAPVPEQSTTTTQASTTTDAPSETADPQALTQDLVLFHRYAVVTTEGETDLAPDLIEAIRSAAPTTADLGDGVTFAFGDAVAGYAVRRDIQRDDLSVIVGVVSDDESSTLAVLATPDDGGEPITPSDTMVIDLRVLGDLVAVGDVVSMDASFAQATAIDDEPAEPVSRFAARIAAGELGYIAAGTEQSGAEPDEAVFTSLLGEVVAWQRGPQTLRQTGDGGGGGTGPMKPKMPAIDDLFKPIRSCKALDLKCVKSYFENLEKKVAPNINDYLDKNLAPDPPPPAPKTPSCRNCGKTFNDPHIITFDAALHGLQTVGEFWLVRSEGLDIQMRTAPLASNVTTISAVALDIGGHTLHVDRDAVFVDGEQIEGGDVFTLDIGDVTATGRGGIVTVTDGVEWVEIDATRSAMAVLVAPPDAPVGLLGDADANPQNDVVGPNGEMPVGEPDSAEWQRSLGDLWRITQDESLFQYEAGESTETFTDRSQPAGLPDIDPSERLRAELVCSVAGVTDPVLLEMCVLDVAVLGVTAAEEFSFPTARLEAAENPAVSEDQDETVLDPWGTSPDSLDPGLGDPGIVELTFDCPALTDPDRLDAALASTRVWGTDVYTDDSDLCVAAVHAGVLDPAIGGIVTFVSSPALDAYEGSTANGVTSRDWAFWPRAFEFVDG